MRIKRTSRPLWTKLELPVALLLGWSLVSACQAQTTPARRSAQRPAGEQAQAPEQAAGEQRRPAAGEQQQAQPLTDRGIADAVENELMFDPAVHQRNVQVTVQQGVVNLLGTVGNVLARQRAERLALTVRGVRSVVNRIEVRPDGERTDQDIAQDVERALLDDPATDTYQVDTRVEDGRVILDGTVSSWAERRLAEKVAASVRGVHAVENELKVEFEEQRLDPAIRADIEQTLRWDVYLDPSQIVVDVEDGQVTLSGNVGSAAEKARAVTSAWVAGVTGVDASGLQVESWAREETNRQGVQQQFNDPQLRQAIGLALAQDPRVAADRISVEVSEGIVTLRGRVDHLKARRAAGNDARNTVGVVYVDNRVRVRPDQALTDEQVASRVRAALRRNPFVEAPDLAVQVDDGVTTLRGTVDSYFVKAQADDVASMVAGVVEVRNRLEVEGKEQPLVYSPYVDEYDMYDYQWYDYGPNQTRLSDEEIEGRINRQLYWSPFVDVDEVDVAVRNGTATLTGVVDSPQERRAAVDSAYEGGAIRVINDLAVE